MYFKRHQPTPIPLQPQDLATAEGLLPRLHARARSDGHREVASRLPYVFGHAYCVHCGDLFSVKSIAAALGAWIVFEDEAVSR